MDSLSVKAASAIFSAQNELSGAWCLLNIPDDIKEWRDAQWAVECAQRELCKAISALGGVDRLLQAGA